MNNNKPHNHLSKEDLLELLSNKTGSASDFDALDDFEKDAFEGFSKHTNVTDAKKLMDELDLKISQKISVITNEAKEDTSNKKRFVWLAMAASLALVIGLSVLFFNKQNIETEQSIAFNEKAKQEIDFEKAPVNLPITKQVEAELATNIEEINNVRALNKNQKITTELQKQEIESADNDGFQNKDAIAMGSGNTQIIKTLEQTIPKGATANTAVAREETMADESKPELHEGVATTQPATSNFSKYDMDDNVKSKVSNDKELDAVALKSEAKKTAVKSNAPVAITDAVTITELSASVAKYKGGEKAIEKYVLNYEKENTGAHKLKGKFKIAATVKVNGQLVVSTITGNESFKDFIKEALNTMKNWQPSKTKNGTVLESSIGFQLEF